jgi:ATP-dependent Clp protease adapter protein ClpS
MSRFKCIAALLLALLHCGDAFVANARLPSSVAFVCQPPLLAQAQPEVQIKTKTKLATKEKQKVQQKKKEKTDDPVQKRDDDFQDAPMYKLLLLGDDSYDTEHVVTRMCSIMEDIDEDQAVTVLKQAMKAGKAMCGKYPFERAELFKEQLLRSDPMIFADLEEENA